MRKIETKSRQCFVSRINADKEEGNWMSWWKKFIKPKQNLLYHNAYNSLEYLKF
jgi:hypothetical protein